MDDREDGIELLPFVCPNCLDSEPGTRLYLAVEREGEGRFRVKEPAFWTALHIGDLIEAEEREDGRYHWIRTIEEARVREYSSLGVTREHLEDPAVRTILDEVIEIGGQWEMPVSGWMHIEIPVDADDPGDWEERLDDAIRA